MYNWIVSLHPNVIGLFSATIISAITIITAILAIYVAFKQIAKQFEHKIIYEGWKDFQSKLYDFSHAFSEYCAKVQWYKYSVDNEDNRLVNGGNLRQYRQNKWQEITDAFMDLQHKNVMFLQSFEIHEVIFLPLVKMKNIFNKECREKIMDKHNDFMDKIFPEMSGLNTTLTKEQQKQLIDDFWYQITEVSIFLEDFRNEIQNVTVGKVLGKKIPRRKPNVGNRILTKDGFIIQKGGLKIEANIFIKRILYFVKKIKKKIRINRLITTI